MTTLKENTTLVIDMYATKVRLIWRFMNMTMTIFFLLTTYVNIDDSDWYIWVPIYLIPGCLCLTTAIRAEFAETTIWRSIAIIHCLGCGVCMLHLCVYIVRHIDQYASNRNPLNSEEGRELCGLIIVLLWLLWSLFTKFTSIVPSNRLLLTTLLLLTIIGAILPLFAWTLCIIDLKYVQSKYCFGEQF